MSDQRRWVSIEIAADELNCSVVKVQSLIEARRLQSKTDSFGDTQVSMCSIRATAGALNLKGVR
jgi:hypothetical protein